MTEFSKEQVKRLCGGTLPYAGGFSWESVKYFQLEDFVLQPSCSGNEILPGPGLELSIRTEDSYEQIKVLERKQVKLSVTALSASVIGCDQEVVTETYYVLSNKFQSPIVVFESVGNLESYAHLLLATNRDVSSISELGAVKVEVKYTPLQLRR